MTRDQLVQLLEREVPRRHVPVSKTIGVGVGATEWWQARYTAEESEAQRISRLADAILALDVSC